MHTKPKTRIYSAKMTPESRLIYTCAYYNAIHLVHCWNVLKRSINRNVAKYATQKWLSAAHMQVLNSDEEKAKTNSIIFRNGLRVAMGRLQIILKIYFIGRLCNMEIQVFFSGSHTHFQHDIESQRWFFANPYKF